MVTYRVLVHGITVGEAGWKLWTAPWPGIIKWYRIAESRIHEDAHANAGCGEEHRLHMSDWNTRIQYVSPTSYTGQAWWSSLHTGKNGPLTLAFSVMNPRILYRVHSPSLANTSPIVPR